MSEELKPVQEFLDKHQITYDVQFMGVFPREGHGDHEVANYRITLKKHNDTLLIGDGFDYFVVEHYSCGLGIPARDFVVTGSRNSIIDGRLGAGRIISKEAAEDKGFRYTSYNMMWRSYEKNYRIREAMQRLEKTAPPRYNPPLMNVFMSIVMDTQNSDEYDTLQDFVDTFGIDVSNVQATIDAYDETKKIGPRFIKWLGEDNWNDLIDNYDLEW